MFCFFFFKQKTAYEMRISDWSSDVCSSDLIYTKWRGMGPMTNLLFFPSMVKPAEDCPNRIREWRDRRDRMSMAVLAASTGISQQHLSRIETGKTSDRKSVV